MNRLPSETVEITLGERHKLLLSIARTLDGAVYETVFVGRGKIGEGLDDLFHELGIKLSRAIQGRNPETGEK